MTTSPTPSNEEQIAQPRDAAYWASQGSTFKVTNVPSGALNLNVEGRLALSPLQGFGQMWQKTYRVRLKGAYVQPTGIAPGEVAVINMLIPGTLPVGLPLSTGVLVLYADDDSFTLMTPQGHTFAGWITFSAREEDGYTVAQAQVLLRSYDPIYEFFFRFLG